MPHHCRPSCVALLPPEEIRAQYLAAPTSADVLPRTSTGHSPTW